MSVEMKRAEEALQQNPILSRIVARLSAQTAKGISKYGESVNPSNLSLLEWLEHEQQEATDKMVYIECAAEKVREVTELLQSLRTEMYEDMNCMDLCNGEEWIGDIKKAIGLLQGI